MKIATPQSVLGLLLSVASSAPALLVSAFSAGAGTCVVTSAGPAFPDGTQHFGKGEVDATTGTPLTLGFRRGWTVALGDTVLVEDATTDVNLGTEPSIFKIAPSLDQSLAFAGFLITLTPRDSSIDLSGLLKPIDDKDDTVQALANGENATNGGFGFNPPTVCKNGIAGGTHKDNKEKTETSMLLDTTAALGLVDVTVTIMKAKNSWYHSNYVMNVMAMSTPPPTSTPTTMPTMAPVTDTPTSLPTRSHSPTADPTSAPTTDDTSSPTESPSLSSVPTPGPTASGSPTAQPMTSVLTSLPTESVPPTVSPTAMPVTAEPTAMPATAAPTKSPVTSLPNLPNVDVGTKSDDTSGAMPRAGFLGGGVCGTFVLCSIVTVGSMLASF